MKANKYSKVMGVMIQYISIIKEFTRSERTADWKVFSAMGKTLNIFSIFNFISSLQTKVSIIYFEQESFGSDYRPTWS